MEEDSPGKAKVERGLRITVNLEAAEPGEIIAYKAKRYAPRSNWTASTIIRPRSSGKFAIRIRPRI
jgi:hypothetical protein